MRWNSARLNIVQLAQSLKKCPKKRCEFDADVGNIICYLVNMGAQTIRSISLGMGEIGEERLRLYKQLAAKRGYDSLSAFIVDVVDNDLGVQLPKPKTRQGIRPTRKK